MNYGDPRLPVRFWAKVYPEPNTGCWLWGASTSDTGYGSFALVGVGHNTHRLAFETLKAPVPDGCVIDHIVCDTKACVNPDHMTPTTNRANVIRSPFMVAQMARTHCPAGHPYQGNNLILRRGKRECRTCKRARDGRRRARAKQTTEG